MKKIVALALALFILITAMAACTGGDKNRPSVSSGSTITPSDGAVETSSTPTEGGDFKLPITDEMTTFTIWSRSSELGRAGMSNFNESLGYQELEKRTNIHIEWQLAASVSEGEQFNLMVASQSYPDGIYATLQLMSNGVESYVDNGVIIDMTDLIKKYAPNYQRVRTADEDIRRRTITDIGTLPVMFKIKTTVEPSWAGYLTRADWLSQLGIESPKTFDQYHDLLVKYKNDLNCEIPLSINPSGRTSFFLAGYDLTGSDWQWTSFRINSGVVEYSLTQDSFLDYLTLMNRWFSEGLIDPDFYARKERMGLEYSMISTGRVGMFESATSFIDLSKANSKTEGYELVAVEPPVRNIGDKRKVLISSPYHRLENGVSAITTSCKDPDTLAKYYDYFFTEEGSLLANWGIEGISYDRVDGKPKYKEIITHNPDGLALATARQPYICANLNGLYDWFWSMTDDMSPAARESGEIWDANWEDTMSFPTVSLSEEESSAYSRIMNDVDTYVGEIVVKFILGTEPLTNFDAYVQNIKNLGIDEVVSLQQTAYDRYMSR